jgi:DNA polymerase
MLVGEQPGDKEDLSDRPFVGPAGGILDRALELAGIADHDAVSMRHIAEFFALFGGGVRDAGWQGKPQYARARLAVVPGYTHYNFSQGPDMGA